MIFKYEIYKIHMGWVLNIFNIKTRKNKSFIYESRTDTILAKREFQKSNRIINFGSKLKI